MKIPSLSLPLRLALAATAVLVVTTVAADLMAVRELRANLAESVSGSLSSMIGRMAKQLDQDIHTLKSLLDDEAALVSPLSREEAGELLARRESTLGFAFDYGVLLVDAAGEVVADSKGRAELKNHNLAEYEFFQRTFALRRSIISEPFAGPLVGDPPLVVFTAPLRDADGRMYGMLAGGLNLLDNRMLAQPTGIRTSRYGQIGVFTLDGQVVAHTEKGLILDRFENPLAPPDGVVERARAREITTADGQRALLAAARLENADWLIAGVFSSAEVYAPIEKGFAAAHWWFAAGLAASCALVWLIAWRSVRSLGLLAHEVEGLGDPGDGSAARVGDGYRDEAGMLARAVNTMLDSLALAKQDVDDLSARLAGAEERERRAIAADLHDSVCQTLALANLRLGGLKKRVTGAADRRTLQEVRDLLEQSVGELKTLTFNLSPGILYELGLVPALEWYATEFAARRGLPVTVACAEPPGRLDDGLSIFLYRAAGELITNAAKHASAGAVRVTVGRDGGDVALEVVDDGRGIADDWAANNGFGLRNLREMARRRGGRLTVERRPEGGTLARLWAPLVMRSDSACDTVIPSGVSVPEGSERRRGIHR